MILLQDGCCGFFKTFNAFRDLPKGNGGATRKCYSSLIQEAELLESFLDEHGARENKVWACFTEYIASIRNLLKAAFFCRHLLDRYPYYRLRDPDEIQRKFFEDSLAVLEFLNSSILKLFLECVEAGKKNHLVISESAINPESFALIEANKRLPKNTEGEEVNEQEDRIIELLEKMNVVGNLMDSMKVESTKDRDLLREIVPYKIDEKKSRMLMNHVHSIQSEFDTYIKSTPLEQKHEGLKGIRGYISMPLHLLEMMIWLIHFYERHEDDIRKGEAKSIISGLVNKTDLLSHVVNYCFFLCSVLYSRRRQTQ